MARRFLLMFAIALAGLTLVAAGCGGDDDESSEEAVPALTEVADPTSLAVRQQYEENPYPLWVRSASVAPAPSVDAYVRQSIPREPFAPPGKGGDVDILVAGCGTGPRRGLGRAHRRRSPRLGALSPTRYIVPATRSCGRWDGMDRHRAPIRRCASGRAG